MSELDSFRREHGLPAGWRPKNLWDEVKRLFRENHGALVKENIRDSYYMIRELITPFIKNTITQHEYNWLITDQGYSSYRDDILVQLEQKEDLERPEAEEEGCYYQWGEESPISRMGQRWPQTRGWIFVEKRGEAKHILGLSREGWNIVVAGKGFPTRLIRRMLREEDKPVLIFHDADRAGDLIYNVFGKGSRRTSHLNLLIDKSIDIGLHWEDVEALDLPTQPEPPKYAGEPRAEISSLAVLRVRMGIDNPALQYVMAQMRKEHIKISPLETARKELWESEVRNIIDSILGHHIRKIIRQTVEDYEFKGTAVECDFSEPDLELPDVEEIIRNAVKQCSEDVEFTSEDEYDGRSVSKINKELMKKLGIGE